MVTVRGPSSWLEYPQLDSLNASLRPCEVPCQFQKGPTIFQAFSIFFSTSWALQLHWRPFRKTSQPNAVVIFTVTTNHPQSSQVSHSKSWQPLISDSAPEPSFCSVPRNRCAPSRTCAIGSSDPLTAKPHRLASLKGHHKKRGRRITGPKDTWGVTSDVLWGQLSKIKNLLEIALVSDFLSFPLHSWHLRKCQMCENITTWHSWHVFSYKWTSIRGEPPWRIEDLGPPAIDLPGGGMRSGT